MTQCSSGDTLCDIVVYEKEVIIVPVLLLLAFAVSLILILVLRFCQDKRTRRGPRTVSSRRSRRQVNGIDAPIGLNPLEHEVITVDGPTYSTFTPLNSESCTPLELPRQWLPESFNTVSLLPYSFSPKSEDSVCLYRARMDNKDVILRVLKDSASANERQSFLGFASFLWQLGPHPFLPAVLGIVSMQAPLITVVEEMANRDMLGFLWRCRQDNIGEEAPCDLTEKHIFHMATHVASALEYLHSKELIHDNIGARSVLVSQQLTAKLWGLGSAYSRKTGLPKQDEMGTKKWKAPEVLARNASSKSSDVWSFGILLYEMVTLGDVPFAEVRVNELLQCLQRGKALKRPPNCSNTLYSIIKTCCEWKVQDRPTLAEVQSKLQSGLKSANEDTVLRVPEPVNIERYLQEAGYSESISYTVF